MMLDIDRTTFLLGANDPEMRAIQAILDALGADVRYASADGNRVHPGNAFKADPVVGLIRDLLVLIECEPTQISGEYLRIDHHRRGDFGYGLGANHYWEASSIGQLAAMLPQWPGDLFARYRVLAAMDHCPSAAIMGDCRGVIAQEVLDLKVAEIAGATAESEHWVRETISDWESTIALGGDDFADAPGVVMDLTGSDLGAGYNARYLTCQVAALVRRAVVLAKHQDSPFGPEKRVLFGHASPEQVEWFMESYAPREGLVGVYGVPSRGYAGGYVKESE